MAKNETIGWATKLKSLDEVSDSITDVSLNDISFTYTYSSPFPVQSVDIKYEPSRSTNTISTVAAGGGGVGQSSLPSIKVDQGQSAWIPSPEPWSTTGSRSYDYAAFSTRPYSPFKEVPKPSPSDQATITSTQLQKYKTIETQLYSLKDELYKTQDAKAKVDQELFEAREEVKKLNVQVRSLIKRI